MHGTFHTLQEFLLHTKSVTYVIIVLILLGMVGFWLFLSERDEDLYK